MTASEKVSETSFFSNIAALRYARCVQKIMKISKFSKNYPKEFLVRNNTVAMPQSPYSPDMDPCNFLLFPKIKKTLKVRRFTRIDEIAERAKDYTN